MTVPHQDSHEELPVQFSLDFVAADQAGVPLDDFGVSDVLINVQVAVEAVLVFKHWETISLERKELTLVLSHESFGKQTDV